LVPFSELIFHSAVEVDLDFASFLFNFAACNLWGTSWAIHGVSGSNGGRWKKGDREEEEVAGRVFWDVLSGIQFWSQL
jgi:hypothetical protein